MCMLLRPAKNSRTAERSLGYSYDSLLAEQCYF